MANKDLLKLLELVKPQSDFLPSDIPSEPDYSLMDNWAALPELDGYQYLVPDAKYSPNKNNDVDVFYIHPTGFFEKNGILILIKKVLPMKELKLCLQIRHLFLMIHAISTHQSIAKQPIILFFKS